ncbi:hypothetical protein AB0N93_29630 [Streptomyces sp. NPDC091267]|uniref:hypothetical protein n=1 Tax=Streptomyces sp. NPDC091267 TaxID=3155195 RepID=UPI003418AE37
MDTTTLAVTLISVAGTLGGTLGGASLSQRASRAVALELDQRAESERAQERRELALQAKRDLYARLNTTARAYRVAARDAALASERGESVELAHLDAAKDAWADEYSQAQMALAKDVLRIASSLNRSLGTGYSVVKQLLSRPIGGAYRRADLWFSGPLSDGVYLLRVTLRHDLGVEVDPHFEQDCVRMLSALDGARDAIADELAEERSRAATGAASGRLEG